MSSLHAKIVGNSVAHPPLWTLRIVSKLDPTVSMMCVPENVGVKKKLTSGALSPPLPPSEQGALPCELFAPEVLPIRVIGGDTLAMLPFGQHSPMLQIPSGMNVPPHAPWVVVLQSETKSQQPKVISPLGSCAGTDAAKVASRARAATDAFAARRTESPCT